MLFIKVNNFPWIPPSKTQSVMGEIAENLREIAQEASVFEIQYSSIDVIVTFPSERHSSPKGVVVVEVTEFPLREQQKKRKSFKMEAEQERTFLQKIRDAIVTDIPVGTIVHAYLTSPRQAFVERNTGGGKI